MSNPETVASQLESMAKMLEAEGSYESHNFYQAANSIRSAGVIPADPSQLDDVGPKMREYVIELKVNGTHDRLEELRKRHPYFGELTELEGVGPKTASKIYDELSVSTVEGLLDQRGQLTEVTGIGRATAETITESARKT